MLLIPTKTPLHCAVDAGHPEIVRTLLRAGVNPNLKDIEGDTALHMAAASGDSHIAEQLLLHRGLHVNATNMRQRTALHVALMAGHEHTGELLMAAGCDSHMMDVFEKNAHDYLEEYHRRLRELEEEKYPPEHEASKVHFSPENGGSLISGDNDAATKTGNAHQSTVHPQTCEDGQLQEDSFLSIDTETHLENSHLIPENGDVPSSEIEATMSADHIVPFSYEFSENKKDEEENENCGQQDFGTDNNVVSPSDESGHKKAAGKSRGRHRKTSKTSNKGGTSSPRHSRSGAGKGRRTSRSPATSDGGGVLGMVMAGQSHEHHEQTPNTESKADHQHQHGEAGTGGGRGRRRKLGVAYMK